MMVHACYPSYMGGINRIAVQDGLGLNRPYPKNNKSRKGCRPVAVAQVVEHWSSKYEALSSNPSTAERKDRDRERQRESPKFNKT
jgi:hypothetical protein